MIKHELDLPLPAPWENVNFEFERFGGINFLVGPNGSGKSRFAETLKGALSESRLLGTERLQGMSKKDGLGIYGDRFPDGFGKKQFRNIKEAGTIYGAGIDTFVILEERPDIRIAIEATLSSLFHRNIFLDWDSGNLIPKATLASSGSSYRLDHDECHGIKELMVLLTHLYNDQHPYLIIDEPELNLHPQYQAFFMQEARKVAGEHVTGTRQKVLFLITHSPFIVDIRNADDLQSVISFDLQHSMPKSLSHVDQDTISRLSSLIPRLNVHHKQLFFSDNPIFVEGILDAQMLESIQEKRNVSITAAGSCIIDVGGCEEVNKYVELCRHLGKKAFFLYDLDSLFKGNLRQCIKSEDEVSEFLAALGLGVDLAKYCGELDKKLTMAVSEVCQSDENGIADLRDYLARLAENGQIPNNKLRKARVSILIKIARSKEAFIAATSSSLVADIEGRLNKIIEILKQFNILLLSEGALEHYLPSYIGDIFELKEDSKRSAVEREIELLSSETDIDIESRYGGLADCIACLPAKPAVDTDAVLRAYLGDYIHKLQGLVIDNPDWSSDELNVHFSQATSGIGKLFTVKSFKRASANEFEATIGVLRSEPTRTVQISQDTNAGMRRFILSKTVVS